MKLAEIAYFTPEVAPMKAFYRDLLGAAPVAESEDMAIFMQGDVRIFIHRTYVPAEGDLPAEKHIAFTVPDVDAACNALQANGLSVTIPPRDYYWGRSAYLRDPDGNLIELAQAAG